jgi:hypothetical protein
LHGGGSRSVIDCPNNVKAVGFSGLQECIFLWLAFSFVKLLAFVICSFNCHFKNSSSVIALFNTTPAILPVDIAYGTERKGLVLSPQPNILSTVVF